MTPRTPTLLNLTNWQRNRRISTTFEAAEASREAWHERADGRAPNIVRGGSHSGTWRPVNWRSWPAGYLSSDYYPASLLDAAFRVADDESNCFTLPQAVKLVTKIGAGA